MRNGDTYMHIIKINSPLCREILTKNSFSNPDVTKELNLAALIQPSIVEVERVFFEEFDISTPLWKR